jgi:hypothetical protein
MWKTALEWLYAPFRQTFREPSFWGGMRLFSEGANKLWRVLLEGQDDL